MPRQATRLILGRSAEAKLISRLRPFSTGSRLYADDNGNRQPPPDRKARSVAAASALNAMSRPSTPTSYRPLIINGVPNVVQPPPRLRAGPPSNVISLTSLPRKVAGSAIRLVRSPTNLAPRPSSRPGGNGPGPRLGGARPSPGFAGGLRPGGAGRLGGRPGGAGRFGGRPGGAGTMRRGKKPRDGQGKNRKEKEQDESAPIPFNDNVKAYMRETEMGVDVPYKPSISPTSLIGWGPAVATNTPTGLHEIAVRNIRLVGGGRPHSEGEQTFERIDMARWIRGAKPIYFSSIEQKEGMIKTIEGSRKTPKPISQTRVFRQMVKRLQKEHGNNYGAFVKAFNKKFDPAEFRKRAEAAHELKVQRAMIAHSGTVKEAITKYALKGEHPTVQYAEDTYSRLATYHARGSTYRPADAAKFDAKMKTLLPA